MPIASDTMQRQPKPSRKVSSLFWLIGLFMVAFYGFLAFNSGIKLSPITNSTADSAAVVTRIIQQADQQQTIVEADIDQVIPTWAKLSAAAGSEQFTYGSDSVAGTLHHYHQMQSQQKQALSMHMMLGSVLMVCGILQFWPSFRKKHPKAHRIIGGVYIVAALLSMSMSMYHLIHTGADQTYGEFTFFFGLWMLAIGVVLSIALATYYIKKREILQHMGWQALGFGFLLTAPVQRLNWIVLPYFFAPYTTFNEMNYLVNVCLLIETLLLSYLLFHINRNSLRANDKQTTLPLTSLQPSRVTPTIMTGVLALSAVGCIAWYAIWPSFAQHSAAIRLFPATLIQADQAVYANPLFSLLYVGSVLVILALLGLWHRQRALFVAKRGIYGMFAACLVSVAVLWQWAFALGLPSHQTSAGGAFFGMIGALTLLFAVLSLWNHHRQQYVLLNENLRFLLAVVIAPTLVYPAIYLINAVQLVPERFWLLGHAYQISVIAALLTPMLIAYLYTVYDAAPRRSATVHA